MIVEGQVEGTTAAHNVHSWGLESGEEERGGRRRPVADSHFGTEVDMAVRSGLAEGKVQAAAVCMYWVVALGEDKGRQEAPMRSAGPEEDIETEVGHIELSPVPWTGSSGSLVPRDCACSWPLVAGGRPLRHVALCVSVQDMHKQNEAGCRS